MKRISSSTFFYKILSPFLFYGFIFSSSYKVLTTGDPTQSPLGFLIVTFIVLAVATYLFKRAYWDLMDEVLDSGDSLIFRRGRRQQNVPLADIININCIKGAGPDRAAVMIRGGSEMGDELTFILPYRLWPFGTHPLMRSLIERVDQARRHAWQETQR